MIHLMIKNIPLEKIASFAAFSGILGPGIISLGILISGLEYVGVEEQRYNPLNHFVSELGELGVSNLAAAFNIGLIIGGILNTVFMIYLAIQIEHWIRYPLGLLGFVASLSGALVGVFPMNFLEPHILVALTFFDLGMLVAFLYSFMFLFSRKHPFPRWLAIPGLVTAAAFAWFNNFPSEFDADVDFQEGMAGMLRNRPDFIPLALMEWVVILGILIWVLMLGIYLVLKRQPAEE